MDHWTRSFPTPARGDEDNGSAARHLDDAGFEPQTFAPLEAHRQAAPAVRRSGDDLLVLNGIDGTTGGYWTPPLRAGDLGRRLAGRPFGRDVVAPRPLHDEIDPTDLASSGWGILLPPGTDPAVREALAPLIDHRRRQAGERFRLFDERAATRPPRTRRPFSPARVWAPARPIPTGCPTTSCWSAIRTSCRSASSTSSTSPTRSAA